MQIWSRTPRNSAGSKPSKPTEWITAFLPPKTTMELDHTSYIHIVESFVAIFSLNIFQNVHFDVWRCY